MSAGQQNDTVEARAVTPYAGSPHRGVPPGHPGPILPGSADCRHPWRRSLRHSRTSARGNAQQFLVVPLPFALTPNAQTPGPPDPHPAASDPPPDLLQDAETWVSDSTVHSGDAGDSAHFAR